MPWAAQVEGYNTPPDGRDMSCLGGRANVTNICTHEIVKTYVLSYEIMLSQRRGYDGRVA